MKSVLHTLLVVMNAKMLQENSEVGVQTLQVFIEITFVNKEPLRG